MSSISILPQTPVEILNRNTATRVKSTFGAPSFAIYTLGCKVNQADSHQIAVMLQSNGFRQVAFREAADLYVIDTCTVTAEANRKSRKAAARAQRNNPDALVAVTGCAASFGAEQFHRVVPDALVLGNARKFELPELAIAKLRENADWAERYAALREQTGSEPMPLSTKERGVIKVQDGCNHHCAFCIIPTVRGISVQKAREGILSEAHQMLAQGAREIVLTGVSLGDWGRETNRKNERGRNAAGRNAALCYLLREVAELDDLRQLRVSSLDPSDVDEEFLQTIANHPKICPHIHLALQSGSPSTLRRMRRRYTSALYLKWAERWREIRPDGGLTTDVIVGFPGETDEEFEESMEMARQAQFSSIHVFPYSPREGTAAAEFPDMVDSAIQKKRVAQLIALGNQLSHDFASQFVGKVLSVLVEKSSQEGAEGLIPQYVRTHITDGENLHSGDIANVRISETRGGELFGVLEN
ncbi:MAG: tRNA (N(6)-L-threonylcarbamoyladenosine(37)-C(2))-methylthiotransferase MtaB [Abditibacteriaceae bacterium]